MTPSDTAPPPFETTRLASGRQFIEGYGEGRFRIAGRVHSGSVLVFPERTVPWPVREAAEITAQSLSAATAGEPRPEILVVGCGPRFEPPPEGLRQALRQAGVMLEWMGTGAACRTFNVLLADARSVAAALIAVE